MGLESFRDRIRELAKAALNKPSRYGSDVDIYEFVPKEPPKIDLYESRVSKRLENVGIDVKASTRSATYFQVDSKVLAYKSFYPGVEILPLEIAIDEYRDFIRDYLWRAVRVDTDKYTAIAELRGSGGYFIRIKRGVKVEKPIQTCLFMVGGGLQAPHNIVIAEEGSEAHLITGCTIMPEVVGLHVGITEFYIEDRARVTYTMIHAWNKVTHVRPRTGIYLGNDSEYVSYYMTLANAKSIQTFPKIYAKGDTSRAYSSSIILALGDAEYDIGTEVVLLGQGSRGEVVSRVLAKDSSVTYARGKIVGLGEKVKGHVECRALSLSSKARILAVPELESKSQTAELTHEASIGKLAEDEIIYLMSKGFDEKEAESIVIRGFMDVSIRGLLPSLERTVKSVIDLITRMATH